MEDVTVPGHGSLHELGVCDRADDHGGAGFLQLFARGGAPAVEHGHLVPTAEEPPHQVGSCKTGTACDERFHLAQTLLTGCSSGDRVRYIFRFAIIALVRFEWWTLSRCSLGQEIRLFGVGSSGSPCT